MLPKKIIQPNLLQFKNVLALNNQSLTWCSINETEQTKFSKY